jgi:hypothetical protein
MFGAGLLEGDDVGPVTGVLLFLFYLCQYFVLRKGRKTIYLA